ncbi:MAG: DUF3299 domain-containing protein [Gammaproteobacteria bacterium]
MLRRSSRAVRIAGMILCAGVAVGLCGFGTQKTAATGQPAGERQAQDGLPQSHDNIWDAFGKCAVHLDEQKYIYSIEFTPEVKALEGKKISVAGFMLPLEMEEKFTHYLLSKRTPTCPFCPPGEPNEIVEVFSKDPVEWEEGIVTITGVMKFTDKSENGMFFQMNDGQMLSKGAVKPKGLSPSL